MEKESDLVNVEKSGEQIPEPVLTNVIFMYGNLTTKRELYCIEIDGKAYVGETPQEAAKNAVLEDNYNNIIQKDGPYAGQICVFGDLLVARHRSTRPINNRFGKIVAEKYAFPEPVLQEVTMKNGTKNKTAQMYVIVDKSMVYVGSTKDIAIEKAQAQKGNQARIGEKGEIIVFADIEAEDKQAFAESDPNDLASNIANMPGGARAKYISAEVMNQYEKKRLEVAEMRLKISKWKIDEKSFNEWTRARAEQYAEHEIPTTTDKLKYRLSGKKVIIGSREEAIKDYEKMIDGRLKPLLVQTPTVMDAEEFIKALHLLDREAFTLARHNKEEMLGK